MGSSLETEVGEGSWLSPQEVADRCGKSRRRVYDWLAWGWLRGVRLGGRWLVNEEDLAFFERTCRGYRDHLMPSLYDWEPLWSAQPLLRSSETKPVLPVSAAV